MSIKTIQEDKKGALKNWLMLISYKGTPYHGWQTQEDLPTIQLNLEQALSSLLNTPTEIYGSGRTDAGVHANNQTATFRAKSDFDAFRWVRALNFYLDANIVVKWVVEVPLDFHARKSANGKTYRYLINNREYRSAISDDLSWFSNRKLNIDAMKEASNYFLGIHDFSAFRSHKCESMTTLKEMYSIKITKTLSPIANIKIDIHGSSFLQYMVRIMIGTLFEVGIERLKPADIKTILASKDRNNAGRTAPARGLYLHKVHYDTTSPLFPENVEY